MRTGRPRGRSTIVAIIVALVFACVPVFGSSSRQAFAEDELKENKQELREAKARIRARNQRLKMNQRVMNQLATRIERTESDLHETEQLIERLGGQMQSLSMELIRLEGQLNDRNREAYMTAGNEVLYLLTATSAAEAASRLSFLEELNRRDEMLADKVAATRERRSELQAQIGRAQMEIDIGLQLLEADRAALRKKMAETRELVAKLVVEVEEIQAEISRIRPFAVCPIDGPHAVGDGFGIWHHHPKNQGGNHRHMGNDIMAAMGTPIVAPFDGEAVATANFMGGKAVNVYGEYGFVYIAHLASYEQLGNVETGDVIGYVGTTGNASGPHAHFEWHPNDGRAVDPYDFLMLVC